MGSDLIPARRTAAFVFLAALAFFTAGAASRGLWHSDEHRIAEVAREMAAPGGDWLVPHLDGAVYTHKPPLVMWIAAFAHGELGLDLVLASRIPSILGGALAVLATFLIGRRLFGTVAGAAAAVVLATAGEFAWICRRAQYDPLLTGFTTMALWFFVRSRFPPAGERRSPWSDAILGALCTGLAILVKGPVALMFTAPLILVFSLFAREGGRLVTPRAAAFLLALVVPWMWLGSVVAREGADFAHELVIGRLEAQTGSDDLHAAPFWFYLVAFPKGLLPWTLFVPAAVVAVTKWRRDEERRAGVFALAWVAVPLVLMSFVSSKRDLYLLPLYPGAAILVGRLASAGEESLRAAVFAVPRRVVAALFLAAGGAAALGSVAFVADFTGLLQPRWLWVRDALRDAGTPRLLLFAAMAAAIAVLGWQALRIASPRKALGRLLGAAFLSWMAGVTLILPAMDAATSPRPFHEEAARIVGTSPVAVYGVDDFAPHWVMRRAPIPYFDSKRAAERFLSETGGDGFIVAELRKLDRDGWPKDVRIALTKRLELGADLVLLRAAPP